MDVPSTDPAETLATPPRRHRRVRWFRVIISSLIVVVAIGGLLPSLARPWIIAQITESIPGDVSIEDISLSWWSPVTAKGITISTDDQLLLKVGELKTNESLLRLIVTRSVEHIDLQDATLEIRHTDTDSNLESWLRQCPKSKDSSTWSMQVTLKGGQLRIYRSASDPSPYEVLTIDATADISSTKLNIEATGNYPQTGQKLELTAIVLMEEQTIKLNTRGLDIAGIEPWLCRGARQSRLQGQLSTIANIQWKKESEFHAHIEELRADDLDIELPRFGLKRINLSNVEAHVQIVCSKTGVALDGKVDSSIGTLNAAGMRFNLPKTSDDWQDIIAPLRGGCDIELQLAEAVAAAPWLIPVKDDLQLTEGTLKLRIQAGTEPTERLIAELSLADAKARSSNALLVWEKPIQLAIDIRRDEHMQVENLKIDSEFVTARLNGSIEVGNGTLSGDLGDLYNELSRWIEMPIEAMGGKLSGELHWRLEQQRIVARGELDVLDAVIQHDQTLWSDARLHLDWNSVAQLSQEKRPEILSGDLVLSTSQGDRLEWHAQRTAEGLKWNGETHLQLANLPHPLKNIEKTPMVIDGTLSGTATGITNDDGIQIAAVEATVDRFFLDGQEMSIREPTVIFRGSGTVRPKLQQVHLDQFEFTSTTIAFGGQQLLVNWTDPSKLSFQAAVRADLSKIDRWIPVNQLARNRWQGEFVGNVTVMRTPQRSSVEWTGVVDQFSIQSVPPDGHPDENDINRMAQEPTTIWTEQELKTAGELIYQTDEAALTMNVSFGSESLQLTLDGQILDVTGLPVADLTGDLTYDLAALEPKIQMLLDPSIQLSGKGQHPITLRGPVFKNATHTSAEHSIVHRQLEGTASVAWESVSGYGAFIGKGEIRGELKDGKVTFAPLECALAGGQLNAELWIDLRSSPARLLLMPGPLMKDVNITPKMCQSWIQYAVPLLANATQAQGRFSAQLDHAEFPIDSPRDGSAAGTLQIHEGRIAASPLAQQILTVASQVRAVVRRSAADINPRSSLEWVALPPQDVEFRLVKGAVEHRRFEVRVDDVQLITSGKVYIKGTEEFADHRIELVCEVPIQDKWIKSNRLLASLRNSKLKIPISGTLSKPRIDARVLRDFSKQMLRGVAEDLIRDQLEKGLRQLFNNPLP
jgi:hypothetical protein